MVLAASLSHLRATVPKTFPTSADIALKLLRLKVGVCLAAISIHVHPGIDIAGEKLTHMKRLQTTLRDLGVAAITGGDFNATPEEMQQSGWSTQLRATLWTTQQAATNRQGG